MTYTTEQNADGGRVVLSVQKFSEDKLPLLY